MPNVVAEIASRNVASANHPKRHRKNPKTADLGYVEDELAGSKSYDNKKKEFMPVRA